MKWREVIGRGRSDENEVAGLWIFLIFLPFIEEIMNIDISWARILTDRMVHFRNKLDYSVISRLRVTDADLTSTASQKWSVCGKYGLK